jgi:hypothetical protein
MNVQFNMSLRGVDVEVNVTNYSPSRPAPHCSNPDSPRYADSGDGADWDDFSVSVECIDITDLLSQKILDEVTDKIVEEGEQHARDIIDDRKAEMYESMRENREDR